MKYRAKKAVWILVAMLLSSSQLSFSQLCTGNLGDNIFTDGDFGSGTANVVVNDPGIAPGYEYNATNVPADSQYVITNNTANIQGLYDSWLRIGDNSNNPFGYMMVVNATFSPGLFYEQEVNGLCENTTYEFSADIINMIRRNVTNPFHIRPNVSFLIDGSTALSTGTIPQDESWHSFGFTFTTGIGQTSVTLALRNNAPGGIGNDLALDNISFRACGPSIQTVSISGDSICADINSVIELEANVSGNQFPTPQYQWQQSFDEGQTWQDIADATNAIFQTSSTDIGNNYFRVLLANSQGNLSSSFCRVNSDPRIVYVAPTTSSLSDTVCTGLSYQFANQTFDSSGIYRDTLSNFLGCDSVVTLNLTVLPDPEIAVDYTLNQRNCQNQAPSSLAINSVNNGFAPYELQLGNQVLSSSDSVFSNLGAGDYILMATDRFGCTFEQEISIDTFQILELDLSLDTVQVLLGDPIGIEANANFNIVSYDWSPSPDSCGLICSSFSGYLADTTLVTLTATSERGCEISDSTLVEVNKVRLFTFPTAFSPNNDGRNDTFMPTLSFPNVVKINKFLIFDRWGNTIYSIKDLDASSINTGWNGQRNSQPLPAGVYYYKAVAQFLDNEQKSYSGGVLLIR